MYYTAFTMSGGLDTIPFRIDDTTTAVFGAIGVGAYLLM